MKYRPLLAVILVIGFCALGISNITSNKNKLQLKDIQVKSKSTELKSLELKYDHLEVELNKADKNNKVQIKKLEQEKQQLEQERQRLEKEVAIKKQVKDIAAGRINSAALAATGTATASASTCGDNEYAHYIYMHESGCNPAAVNSIGCRGIGQACPGSKLPCGADYACQNAWFTDYANRAYGGWAGAYQAWLSKHWW